MFKKCENYLNFRLESNSCFFVINFKDFESVWRVVDENNDGAVDYGEFMRAFIGKLSVNKFYLFIVFFLSTMIQINLVIKFLIYF